MLPSESPKMAFSCELLSAKLVTTPAAGGIGTDANSAAKSAASMTTEAATEARSPECQLPVFDFAAAFADVAIAFSSAFFLPLARPAAAGAMGAAAAAAPGSSACFLAAGAAAAGSATRFLLCVACGRAWRGALLRGW